MRVSALLVFEIQPTTYFQLIFSSFPTFCRLCEGDCDDDSDCEGDLVCLERDGFDAVDGCTGAGGDRDVFGKDVCVPPTNVIEVQYVGNPCTDAFPDGKCEVCTGDCDSDSDCADGLRCASRRESNGLEIVPGCIWTNDTLKFDDGDYCKYKLFLTWILLMYMYYEGLNIHSPHL